ncbi:hypothetical protein [Streptomyces millisiae]|uniref:Uncharacterized protein n=1 Tax=Streptomyces millisiae TaxID=3075542 RepID=A0ABU2LLQ5_9ACTN|nr:hypothetical protein [Streptomyces sp. DSM 44918]MDT0318517.1 hypothetical protein [Streptomyces sp. DSM 44918]
MSETSNTWRAAPQEALWFGAIIFGRDVVDGDGEVVGSETDYAYGYSTDPLPDPREMCPDRAVVLEEKLTHLQTKVTLSSQNADPSAHQREFRVWCENGDLVAVSDTYEEAAEELRAAVQGDVERLVREDAACGVLSTYGYSIDVIEGGQDVTQDFLSDHPDCPLDDGAIVEAGE